MNNFSRQIKTRKTFFYNPQGSISLYAAFGIIFAIIITAVAINIGNLLAKRTLVQDNADEIAPALLAHQIGKSVKLGQNRTNGPASAVADAFIGDQGAQLKNSNYIITFGTLNINTAPKLPDGFFAFGTNESGNPTINPTDPDLDNVVLLQGKRARQEFAVAYQLFLPVSLAGQITKLLGLDFDQVVLQGRAIASTDLAGLIGDADPDKKEGCCCTEVAGGNSVIFSGDLVCRVDTGELNRLGNTKYEFCYYCFTKNILCNNDPNCDDFNECQGTFVDNWRSRILIRSFVDMFVCWFQDFFHQLINTIHLVNQAIIDAWNGWTDPNKV